MLFTLIARGNTDYFTMDTGPKYRPPFVLALALLVVSALGAAESTTRTSASKPSAVCPHETDPTSPRRTRLHSSKPDDEMVRTDLTGDGKPDLLETWWNGKRVRWIDECGKMKSTDVRGSISDDCLQVDRDGDGYFDGPGDINIKWIDDDDDGKADLQIIAANPDDKAANALWGLSHYMIFVDDDHDGVLGYIDWRTFDFGGWYDGPNWRVAPATKPWRPQSPPNFSADYSGNATFLKQHGPAWMIADPRFNWENPFFFFDTDGDGCTEMSVRFLDPHPSAEAGRHPSVPHRYTGKANEAYVSYDLDNDSNCDNEFDYDMSIRFASPEGASADALFDYSSYGHPHPKLKAPAWAIDLFRFPNWRQIDDLVYVSRERAHDAAFATKWKQAWFVFDEDDDDHRWERIELYPPTDDVYDTRGAHKDHRSKGLDSNFQSDSLGDRAEWDQDNSGSGKLYVGKWDGKLHLFGAEKGAWAVDANKRYWGSLPVVGDSSPHEAPVVNEVVCYADTDGNGFFDHVTYDSDGDQKIDLTVNLLDFKSESNPRPDECELFNPAELPWDGMHALFNRIARKSFEDAASIYRAAWKKGLTDSAMDELAIASSTWEEYDHGYALNEALFRLLDRRFSDQPALRQRLRHCHFGGDVAGVVRMIEELAPPRKT
jgi:hypothetical protein